MRISGRYAMTRAVATDLSFRLTSCSYSVRALDGHLLSPRGSRGLCGGVCAELPALNLCAHKMYYAAGTDERCDVITAAAAAAAAAMSEEVTAGSDKPSILYYAHCDQPASI